MSHYGSVPTGPSELYLKLLKGEIAPAEYNKRVKDRGEAEERNQPSGDTGAQSKRGR